MNLLDQPLNTYAVHQIVNWKYKVEGDEMMRIYGLVFDHVVSRLCYYSYRTMNIRGLLYKAIRHFAAEFKENLPDLDWRKREKYIKRGWRMLAAFTRTPIYQKMMLRPKTRAIAFKDVNIVVYAQLDFTDNKNIYELKTFDVRGHEEVDFQVRLFQLAYPHSKAYVIYFVEKNGLFTPRINIYPRLKRDERKSLINEILSAVKDVEPNGRERLDDIAMSHRVLIYNLNGKLLRML